MDKPAKKFKTQITLSLMTLVTLMAIIFTVFGNDLFAQAAHEGTAISAPKAASASGEGLKFGLIAAAAAFGFGAIGAGYSIAHVGAAAIGAIAEKPQIAGQALIFVALAEGILVFGFITALMILGKI